MLQVHGVLLCMLQAAQDTLRSMLRCMACFRQLLQMKGMLWVWAAQDMP
jgi:hypothetical protein